MKQLRYILRAKRRRRQEAWKRRLASFLKRKIAQQLGSLRRYAMMPRLIRSNHDLGN